MAEESLPSGGRSREDIAKIEIGVTTISRTTARLLVVAFLLLIFTVPAIELIAGRAEGERTATWSHLSGIREAIRDRLAEANATPGVTLWQRTLAVNRGVLSGLQDFEQGLERESRLGQTLRPHAQLLLTRWLGAGNERVYPGRAGWVFYRPDVEYVTGPGFLEPSQQRRRIASASEWSASPAPDPRPAILQFKRDLDARGIALVVVPTPVKPSIHPEMLSPRLATVAGPIHNASYASFIAELEHEGVLVFDPSAILAAARRTSPQYLATDTHWRPEAMAAAADGLAEFIRARVRLAAVPEPGYRLQRSEQRHEGDTYSSGTGPRGVFRKRRTCSSSVTASATSTHGHCRTFIRVAPGSSNISATPSPDPSIASCRTVAARSPHGKCCSATPIGSRESGSSCTSSPYAN